MEACEKLRGEKDTFVIRVSRSESGAWHGNIVWVDQRCEQSFNSMQEMLSLLDCSISDEPAYLRLVP